MLIWLQLYPSDFPGGAVAKNLPANAGDTKDVGLISRPGRSPGVENGNPLQYFCLENCVEREAWQATVHSVTKTLTQHKLLDFVLILS